MGTSSLLLYDFLRLLIVFVLLLVIDSPKGRRLRRLPIHDLKGVLHHHSPIDREHLAGDKFRLWRGEKGDSRGDVRALPKFA